MGILARSGEDCLDDHITKRSRTNGYPPFTMVSVMVIANDLLFRESFCAQQSTYDKLMANSQPSNMALSPVKVSKTVNGQSRSFLQSVVGEQSSGTNTLALRRGKILVSELSEVFSS